MEWYKTSTPYFLDNTLVHAYLDQMYSRWTEEATKDMYWPKISKEAPGQGIIGKKKMVLDNWQLVVDAMPKAHIWTELRQINRQGLREKRKLT